MGRHSEYRLLGGQFDCERLLRQFLCRIATEPDAAVGSHHIHASVSVVDGHLVVLDPVGVLAADPEINELVHNRAAYDISENICAAYFLLAEIPAAALLYHHNRQSGVTDRNVISLCKTVLCDRERGCVRPIHFGLSALQRRAVNSHDSAFGRCELRHKIEVVQVRDDKAHLVAVDCGSVLGDGIKLRRVT